MATANLNKSEDFVTNTTTTSKSSHIFNKRGAWNKRGGGAKVAKLLNVELGINVKGGKI